ncbi:bifunctional phosphopantothenoylcysteine decarboxylase/phosphopantothenate--cysteine ligase CoaBC [Microbacterium sp. TNHR37B]|uniref:bifunctional phosphopantothenoylcysteine decarboxylase/phosphopantothenate--cysteine ligase CoaBC n=1 Tax=Microbacterium sp. TNHR37B TaxID=1775956 RepID=UPI0007B1DE16|nr:bifunctional phosphopantothenoylcysteine decarboxylase/phosphopantothenate--cysteine ligase CoaBC [Microbacterium sp. TNHR37B]KZE88688.1 Coenzyme A biosynthesis bifunctional protein CoaBC [Microbacterium sp. TNHR37B]
MFVVVGVSGGIAAYKTVTLVRALVTNGHEVHVVPTEDALRFVGTATWEAISRHPVTTSVHDDVAEVRHVALGTRADLVIVAPATANTLAKMSAGIAGDLLGVTLLATTAPVLVAPAMHTAMWEHPATQHNITTLRSRGVQVIGPADGPLTGGDSGPGRMVEPEEIAAAAEALLAPRRDLADRIVAVSTGGTREPLDPVRFLGNRSSGRQGAEVALAAAARGARVRLVAGHVDDGVLAAAAQHPSIEITRVSTAADLHEAMRGASAGADVVVMVAAVADFRPQTVSDQKLRKEDGDGTATLSLVANPDILLDLVAHRVPGQRIVGFAAETAADDAELLERGRRKLARKGTDLLVVNRVDWDRGFESPDNEAVLLTADGPVGRARGTKREVADALWDAVAALPPVDH